MLQVSDFVPHIEFARQLAETGVMLPHFGYHALVIVVQALTSVDWAAAAGIVTLAGVAACAAVVAWWLRRALGTSASKLLVAAALVPAALSVLQPILPLDPTRYNEWLIGYFPPNQWHSPTTLFSKPFALLLLGLGPAVCVARRGHSGRLAAHTGVRGPCRDVNPREAQLHNGVPARAKRPGSVALAPNRLALARPGFRAASRRRAGVAVRLDLHAER